MTEFYKGSVPCVVGQSTYQVVHPKINDPLSYPFVSMMIPTAASAIMVEGITNKTTVSFDVILTSAPSASGYAINWQINIPGTDVAEYVNDKRYYSKEEIGSAKLARVHWKNVIAAPDMSSEGLRKNHNHDDRYYTKAQIVPVIDSRITQVGSYGPLANTLMLRDASGRSQVNTPKVNSDASNKGYVDTKVAGEASSRASADLALQSEITNISGSYATNLYVQQLETQLNFLESIITTISGSGFYSGGNVPVGSVVTMAASSDLGMDWRHCNGSALDISGFSELFSVIGYTFGGSGTYFNIPDLRGEFIRGWDEIRGVDYGRAFGSWQDSENRSHTHPGSTLVSAADHIHTISPTAPTTSTSIAASGFDITVDVGTPGASATQAAGAHTHSINISADGTYESRPRNIALKFFIKVSNPVMIQPVDISTSQSISGQKSFTEAIVVPELPQAIIFGDPLTIGTKALGIIGGQMVISMYTSAAVWSPIVWLS